MKKFPILVTLFLLFISCKQDNSPVLYSLEVYVTPENSGVISSYQDTLLEAGSDVSLTATANEEYSFTGWSGDVNSKDNPLDITLEEDVSLTANFELKTYSLTTEVIGEGEVTETVLQTKTDYSHGTLVRLEAVADTGWVFTGWSGNIESEEKIIEISVESELHLIATFEKQVFSITINTQGEGRFTDLNGELIKSEYEYGDELTLIAVPDSSWIFKGWSGDYTEDSDTLFVLVDSDVSLSAVFVKTFLLDIQIQGNGTILSDDLLVENIFEEGSEINIQAKPDTTWVFKNWTGDISSSEESITVVMNSNLNLTLIFEKGVLDYCIPISLNAYRHKGLNDSVKTLDWDFKIDGRYYESFEKRIDFTKTGNFSPTLIRGEFSYTDDSYSEMETLYPISNSKNRYQFVWDTDQVEDYTHIIDSNIYEILETDELLFTEPCGLQKFDGTYFDRNGIENATVSMDYSYENNCRTISFSVLSDTIMYSDKSSIYKDVLGFPGYLGSSYEHIISEQSGLLIPNKENLSIEQINTNSFPLNGNDRGQAVERYEYLDFIIEEDYPRYFTRNIDYSKSTDTDTDSFIVEYYCGYKLPSN